MVSLGRRSKIVPSVAALALLSVIVSGCSFFTSQNQVQEVSSVIQETDPPAAPSWTQTASPSPTEACKVADGLPQELLSKGRGSFWEGRKARGPVGFPWVSSYFFPNKGDLNFLMLLVSFEDTTKFVENPTDYLDAQASKLSEWADFFSQGQMRWNVETLERWVDLPYSSQVAPQSDTDLGTDIINQLEATVDIEDYDGVLLQWAPGVQEGSRTSFGLRLNSMDSRETDSFKFRQMVWAPDLSFYRNNGQQTYENRRENWWGSMVHEILHEMNMNLHAPGNGWATSVGNKTNPSGNGGVSYAITAWEQFLLGWVKDSQIQCVSMGNLDSEQTAILTPLEIFGGERKALVVVISESDVVVVESRRPIGYSKWWNQDNSGALVYTVNPQVLEQTDHIDEDCGNDPTHTKWAYYLFPDQEREDPSAWCGAMGGAFHPAIFDEGETLTRNGVRIEVVHSADDKDYVRVTRSSDDSSQAFSAEPLEPAVDGGWWNQCEGPCPLDLPNPPQNLGHTMETDRERIPRLGSCEELSSQWGPRNGVAASTDFRDKAGAAVATMISTQWYAVNRHLDTNLDGVICSCQAPESTDEQASSTGESCVTLQIDINAPLAEKCEDPWWLNCFEGSVSLPVVAENSNHNRPTDDPERIGPPNCEGLRQSNLLHGIAASFDYRDAVSKQAMVSTQWYAKLHFLDTNLDGVACGPGDDG